MQGASSASSLCLLLPFGARPSRSGVHAFFEGTGPKPAGYVLLDAGRTSQEAFFFV
jgi:hypothetical protein